jgi:hypothetical protein
MVTTRSFSVSLEDDHDIRRAAGAQGLGPSEFARAAVMHAVRVVFEANPEARTAPVPAKSTRGRPRLGESYGEAHARRTKPGG